MASPNMRKIQEARERDKEYLKGTLVEVPQGRRKYKPLRIKRGSNFAIEPIRKNGQFVQHVKSTLQHYREAGYGDPKVRRGNTHSTNPYRQNNVGKRVKPGQRQQRLLKGLHKQVAAKQNIYL